MSIDLKKFLEDLKDQSIHVEVFPCDYQDTYDLGVEHGKILLARELWRLLCLDVEM